MTRLGKLSLALFCCSVCFSGWIVSTFLRAAIFQPEPRALYETISKHIGACRTADFQSAYEQAATRVQRNLTLVEFERGVRGDPAQTNHRMRVEFGPIRWLKRSALVEVYYVAPDGGVIPRLYLLVPERGSWRIAMVERFRSWVDGSHIRGTRS
jgi:hypothetical protein